jgi:hypothetical protein
MMDGLKAVPFEDLTAELRLKGTGFSPYIILTLRTALAAEGNLLA